MRLIPLRPRTRAYEPLSPQDASFLAFEKPNIHMSVGAVMIFEIGSFRSPAGSVDVEKFTRYIHSRIANIPRTRQRLSATTILRRPIWIDDEGFRIEQHVGRADLGAASEDPGAIRKLSGEIFSLPLDRTRPLWEITVVDGAPGMKTFAVICKSHHGMIDGIAGMDFAGALLTGDPQDAFDDPPLFRPSPAPGAVRLALGDLGLLASAPPRLAAGLVRLATRSATRASFRERTGAVIHLFASGLRGTTETPLSAPPRPGRLHGWHTASKSDERSIRARLGGSRDEVTLAAAAGATRAFLIRRGVSTKGIRIRAMAPMSLRSRAERGFLGNRVSMLIVDLPVDEADPARRLHRVTAAVARLKHLKQGLGVDVLAAIDEFTGTLAQRFAMWLATTVHTYNIVVTNVPGPPTPLYALESQLLAIYPMAPVFGGQHINFAAISYHGTLHWGVQYAGDDPAEFHRIVQDLATSFDDLVEAAAAAPPRLRVVEPASDIASPDAIAT